MTNWNVRDLAGAVSGLNAGLRHLAALIGDQFEKRRTVAMMQNMDARLLADIGVERYEIEALVYGTDGKASTGWSLKSLTAPVARLLQRGQAIRELAVLPDYLLADIGVERGMIDELVDYHLDIADRHDRTIAASVADRFAAAKTRLQAWNVNHKSAQDFFRLDPALLADLGYSNDYVDWKAERQVATANANKQDKLAA